MTYDGPERRRTSRDQTLDALRDERAQLSRGHYRQYVPGKCAHCDRLAEIVAEIDRLVTTERRRIATMTAFQHPTSPDDGVTAWRERVR